MQSECTHTAKEHPCNIPLNDNHHFSPRFVVCLLCLLQCVFNYNTFTCQASADRHKSDQKGISLKPGPANAMFQRTDQSLESRERPTVKFEEIDIPYDSMVVHTCANMYMCASRLASNYYTDVLCEKNKHQHAEKKLESSR